MLLSNAVRLLDPAAHGPCGWDLRSAEKIITNLLLITLSPSGLLGKFFSIIWARSTILIPRGHQLELSRQLNSYRKCSIRQYGYS